MRVALRVGSILLILVGFILAALSHPKLHSMSITSDKVINNLLVAGVACTLLGIMAFFIAIGDLDRKTKRLWFIPTLVVLTMIFGFLVFRFSYIPPLKFAEGGDRISKGALSIRLPTKYFAPPKAGIVFGTVTVIGQPESVAYVFLLQYGGTLTSYGSSSPNAAAPYQTTMDSPDGRWGEVMIGFTVNGMPIDGRYYIEIDESLKNVVTETISVYDNSYDLSAGRVFLIDLSLEKPSCQQLDVTIPQVPAELKTQEQIMQTAKDLRETLRKLHPKINEFLS